MVIQRDKLDNSTEEEEEQVEEEEKNKVKQAEMKRILALSWDILYFYLIVFIEFLFEIFLKTF